MGEHNKRIIAVFTGNRAEYGLQYPIIRAIEYDERVDYRLIVAGAHLKGEFGDTLDEIRQDRFVVHCEIEVDLEADHIYSTASAIGSGIMRVSEVLKSMEPDILVVYADRFEGFAALIAGTQMGIPTAHVEGGDYTDGGALDDSVRHAMTKLAHIHFTTNSSAKGRVLAMGEEPWRVHDVGYPTIDLIKEGNFSAPEEIYSLLNLDGKLPILAFTQHSVTTEFSEASQQIRSSLIALETAGNRWGVQSVITYPNNDAGGRSIIEEIKLFEKKKLPFIRVIENLGRYRYHGLLNVSDICIGNSSSGIKETAAFKCPCINIGSRQRGRMRAENVIDVGYESDEIIDAIETCMKDSVFLANVAACNNPYGDGNTGSKIVNVLATVDLDKKLVQKKMMY